MMARSITIPIVFVVTFCGSSPDFIARAAPTDVKPNVSVNVQNLLRRCASESADDRVEAVETLGKLGEEAAPAIPTLVKLLGDQQAVQRDLPHQPPLVEVSYFASEALRAIGTPALEACIEALGTAEGTQKGRIIITIGKFKNRRALETLLTVLDDPNPDLRCNAIGSSTFLGCKDFVLVARLTKLLASDPDADIRWRSARVLASCGAIEPVIQALKNDKNGTVRADAAEALAKTGNAAVVPVLLQALREDYGEPDWVRRQIIKALGCEEHRGQTFNINFRYCCRSLFALGRVIAGTPVVGRDWPTSAIVALRPGGRKLPEGRKLRPREKKGDSHQI